MTFSNPIVGGVTLIRPAIQSPDYITGSAGWSINKDGSAEFNDVTIRGDGNGDALIVGPNGGPQVQVGSSATAGYIQFPTNRPIENTVAQILVGVLNQGAANEAASLQITGPTVNGATDQARFFLNSQNNDGSSQANASLVTGGGSVIMDENTLTASGPRIVHIPADSGSTALLVNPSATYTGGLCNLMKGTKSLFFVANDGRLLVTPDASANSAVFVNADAGYTGNMLRLSENNVDAFRVANDGSVTSTGGATFATDITAGSITVNAIAAGNIQKGIEPVTTTAGQWVQVTVNFPQAFTTIPVVTLTGNSDAPALGGTTQLYYAATAISTTQFALRVFRSTAITMNIGWIAIA